MSNLTHKVLLEKGFYALGRGRYKRSENSYHTINIPNENDPQINSIIGIKVFTNTSFPYSFTIIGTEIYISFHSRK